MRVTSSAIGPAGLSLLLVLLSLIGWAVPAGAAEGSQYQPAVRSHGGVVATESFAAGQIGRDVLDVGGNAVDAAIATAFAINVARPQSCGIGGGGFAVVHTNDGQVATLDFRETAPAAVTPDTFAGTGIHNGFSGHMTVGVPGTVAGLWALHERFGTLPWADLIAPAEALAREGVEVPQSLSAAMAQAAPRLRLFPAAAEQFLVGGVSPYPPGSTLVQTDLADSLAQIAAGGPDAFYRGPIGEEIVADMQENAGAYPGDDGLMTMADLDAYEAVFRDPLRADYRGHEVIAMPPPTSGGVAVIEMLNILENFDLRGAGQSSADHLHLVAEAEKIAFADRGAYLGDPDFVDVPVAELTSQAYADTRAAEIDLASAGSYEPGTFEEGDPPEEGGDANPRGSTTHLSVLDAAGNAIALTCTIEQTFGSAVVAPGTGFLLNNELTDFSGAGTANEPMGGKRPRSSISPTIVLRDGRPVLAVGAAGGATIIMGSHQAVVNMVDFDLDVAQALDAERLEASTVDMQLENVRVSPEVQQDLRSRGHEIVSNGEYGAVPRAQAVGIDVATREATGASDSRTDQATYGQESVVLRAAGEGRIQTAIAVSQQTVGFAPTVVLASAASPVDALAGARLAVQQGGPLLLTDPSGVHEDVMQELVRLRATDVVLLGGESALTPAVQQALESAGLAVQRIGGATRVETAAAIAGLVERPASPDDPASDGSDGAAGQPDGQPESQPDGRGAIVVNGNAFADALSAGPLSAVTGQPILLVTRDSVPTATAEAIAALDITHTTIVGGTAVVSDEVAAALPSPNRLAGADRYATNDAVRGASASLRPERVLVADGRSLVDALAAGAAAGTDRAALLLVDGTDPATVRGLDQARRVTILGGPSAVSAEVEQSIRGALGDGVFVSYGEIRVGNLP